MDKICCIISAGDVNNELLYKRKDEYGLFIAADLGYTKALNAKVNPTILIGDFDSISQSELDNAFSTQFKPHIIRHPVQKDFSDTHLAIEEGIRLGYTCFHIYGALGGDRFSHSLANLQTLCYMKQKNVSITLIGEKECVYLLQNEKLTLPLPIGSSFSVFSLSNEATGVSIEGAAYPLANATLTNAFPLGVSNHTTKETVTVSCTDGFLLVITEFKKSVYETFL